ncbi:uncharacterized protein LOC124257079 [Haliotis rubra]|uniref:uncharacterized protein LOC124257079 n=1 Tax=Haliotis rubra TaxID=36100 RepID=UPI001EE5D69C|nr:uncharacterized protein LOC124257079 [Haliotis rubra]XP_046547017.1 uncharacterized protein LOC124257079 [Haliotis rubra]
MNSSEILLAVCVSMAFIVDVILIGYYMIKRTRKPAKCPVIVEYACHQSQPPDRDDPPQEKEEVKVVFINNRAEANPDQDDYDTLWSVDRLQRDIGTTSVYSHVIRSNNACVSTEENHYDSAALPYLDRRPINNVYERMYMSEE